MQAVSVQAQAWQSPEECHQPEAVINSRYSILFLIGMGIYFVGCGSSEQSVDEHANAASQKTKQRKTQTFQVQSDTLSAQPKKKNNGSSTPFEIRKSIPKKYYSVQIGAFRSNYNIKRNQSLLEERFHQPVIVFYSNGLKLTRMCVGKFSSEEEAKKFLRQMKAQFPGEYNQAWVAELVQ